MATKPQSQTTGNWLSRNLSNLTGCGQHKAFSGSLPQAHFYREQLVGKRPRICGKLSHAPGKLQLSSENFSNTGLFPRPLVNFFANFMASNLRSTFQQ